MELEFVRWLDENLPSPGPHLGIGDDAAVLSWRAESNVVVATDAITDEVDFHLQEVTPQQIGRKALGVNLSDLAAMAAEPVAAFLSLILPVGEAASAGAKLAQGIIRGMLPLAHRYDLIIAGGDTNSWNHPLAVSVTVVGRTTPRGPLTRSGGQPGDVLVVTGSLGGSILGRHLAVEPRVDEALKLHRDYDLHAGIDVSDGLALDAWRLAEASGCGAVLDRTSIPVAEAAGRLARRTGKAPLDHALADGEDFELLLAAPPAVAEQMLADQPLAVPLARIGELTLEHGLRQRTAAGELAPLEPTGYRH